MKKQEKIYRNVGGNEFRLLSESINNDEKPQGSNLVREGLKKVFASSGKEISYKRLANVGLGYIKNVADATKCALREAQELAQEYGYTDDENNQKFVKSEETHPESGTSNPEEKREVQIGKEILNALNALSDGSTQKDSNELADDIRTLAQELIDLHSPGSVVKPGTGGGLYKAGSVY